MRLYSSSLVHCWLTEDGLQGKQSVLQVEHIQSGASTRAQTLAEVEPWIFETCRASKSSVEAAPAGGANRKTSKS